MDRDCNRQKYIRNGSYNGKENKLLRCKTDVQIDAKSIRIHNDVNLIEIDPYSLY